MTWASQQQGNETFAALMLPTTTPYPQRPQPLRQPREGVTTANLDPSPLPVALTWMQDAMAPASRRPVTTRILAALDSTAAPPIYQSGVVILVGRPYELAAGDVYCAGAVVGDNDID